MRVHYSPNLVVLGGTGFIGRHFVPFARAAGWHVRALTRNGTPASSLDGVDWVRGTLDDVSVWPRLLIPGCVVVNLGHAQRAATAEAVATTRRMVDACVRARVSRLVHCSSISVYGRASVGEIDERVRCRPVDDYGRNKLAVEEALFGPNSGGVEITVLRPAAVFGPGGAALRTMVSSLLHGSRWKNYLRSSLFGRRHMHLVPVSKVVSALSFLSTVKSAVHGEVFNVTDDTEPLNNFRDVESLLIQVLEVSPYRLPRLPIPGWLLGLALYARGRGEIDPTCRYSSGKLHTLGFVHNSDFESELRTYIAHCRTSLE